MTLLEVYPEYGKTTVLAALAILYYIVLCYNAGMHVLLFASSNAAVDALSRELVSLTNKIDYVCVRQTRGDM